MIMKNSWKTESSKIIYQNEWMKFVVDQVVRPDGKKGIYSYVSKLPGVVIIPLTERNELYFVGQWRYPIKKYSWELPMGTLEKGEQPLQSAKREFLEEANLTAKKWDKIGSAYFANGSLDQIAYLYLARGLSPKHGQPDEYEKLTIKKFSFNQIEKMIKAGKIHDAITIAAYYKLLLYLKK
jgi:8-oxo-dGTP pyrophosphatase MutT (NUDIX family)